MVQDYRPTEEDSHSKRETDLIPNSVKVTSVIDTESKDTRKDISEAQSSGSQLDFTAFICILAFTLVFVWGIFAVRIRWTNSANVVINKFSKQKCVI